MKTVLLLSSNKALQSNIPTVLPENWSVTCFSTMGEVQNHLISTPAVLGERIPIMVDVTDQPNWGDKLSQLRRESVLILTIIKEPSERDAVLRTGADDYLLTPLHPLEIKTRLTDYPFSQQPLTRDNPYQQIVKNERLIAIGRLTSHIVHEINNPMQAIRGALTLALEESNNSESIVKYLTLCQQESQRVVKLVERMRQLYRPQANWELVDPCALLIDALSMVSDEINRLNVNAHTDIPSDLPMVNGNSNQLCLVFLTIILNLADITGAEGGGELLCRACLMDQFVEINISADIKPTMIAGIQENQNNIPDIYENVLSLSLVREIILAHSGKVEILKGDREVDVRVSLPALPPGKRG